MTKSLETIALEAVAEMRRQREPGIKPHEHRGDALIVMAALLRVRDDEREECAKVADAKALEHIELARQFTKTKQHVGAKAHERFALVCNGSDGVAARIRARGSR